MTEEEAPSPNRPPLAQSLLDKKIISEAQADLAVADQETTGLSLDEVFLLRGWIDKETLYKLTSDLTPPSSTTSEPPEVPPSISASYEENLKAYRNLIRKILGGGWD